MKNLNFDASKSRNFVESHELEYIKPFAKLANEMVNAKKGPGDEFMGWIDLPINYDASELSRIKACSKKIQEDSDVLVVVGIGGSYLGARAVIDALSHNFKNDLPKSKRKYPKILYAGNSISSTYMADLLEVLDEVDFSVNVISKSGTTTEPAIAFRILKDLLISKYGENEAKERIYATTDASKGALRTLADEQGYQTFAIPDDVGGRYSVLTPVGLLPIAVAGIDVEELLNGAKDARQQYLTEDIDNNLPLVYAMYRNVLLRKGKDVELLVNYEPQLQYISEWFKQLFGESEGKDNKGIFPASANFSTDLHSMGQYIQDGKRSIFETMIKIDSPRKDIALKSEKQDLDGLNYLSGKTIDYVNDKASLGTALAHTDGNVPNLIISLPALNAYHIGELIYFFEKSCAISGYILGVNPFDQPGVEAYKKNMFALLGKEGYEDEKAKLEKRLELDKK